MPVFQLILTSDTINQGREKINVAFSATTGLWSGSTGFQSLIYNNGTGNIASGDYAIATGSGSTASGDVSFTQGVGNLASGIASHAEGGVLTSTIFIGTSATTFSAHAEGVGTLASGIGSHAEGGATTASGSGSHAEGSVTIASGISSHAEGYTTIASGSASHAEGSNTIANGIASHAQGERTIASGDYSFAGGKGIEIEPILAEGETSFAFYHQDATTFPNFGARADYSVILGGKNHFINPSSESGVILGGELNNITFSPYAIIINSFSADITNSSGTIIGGGGSINGSLLCALIMANGIINLGSQFSMIENSFGPPGGICTISNSSFCKISGRNNFGGVIRNEINDSENSAIYNSVNCRVNYGDRTFVVASRGVSSQTGATTGNKDCLILGNGAGTPSSSNKTIRLQATSGNGFFNGVVGSGADYAEFFEWKDGNINNEKRYGYFVSLNEDKIEIGNHNLIGIVSVTPSVISDAASFRWQNTFVTDEWGNKEYVTYKKYKIQANSENNSVNEEEEIIVSARTINAEEQNFRGETSPINTIENYIEIYFDEKNNVYSVLPGLGDILGVLYTGDTTEKIYIEDVSYPKINPLYDPSQTYTPREERPEWSPIGLLGKLHVRTAESITGSTISANSDGMAINGSDYHVLKQVTDFNEDKGYGVVQILFK